MAEARPFPVVFKLLRGNRDTAADTGMRHNVIRTQIVNRFFTYPKLARSFGDAHNVRGMPAVARQNVSQD